MDIKKAKSQLAAARYNCKEGWPFPDAEIVLNGYEAAIDYIERLQDDNESLKSYTTHKDDCPARQMFYIRECPHCGSRKNYWQSGGYGFEEYRVCEECDGPAYIPEERRGECTCGLEQALKDTKLNT